MSKLLRGEKEVHLNDLLRVCLKAAEHYRLAQDVVQETAPAALLKDLAHNRSSLCRRIEHIIRDCGFLPDTPDPDQQTMRNLTERTKALFSRDEQNTLLNRAIRLETEIRACFESVLKHSWAHDHDQELRRLQKQSQNVMAGLNRLFSSHP